MTQEMMIMAAILVAVILITFIGILSRYRKCKSDEVLVVYGKTGGDKKSAKLYHGGAAFVWPIVQGYEFLSMKPMQIDCKLTGALSAQNIRVDVPTTITVAISTDPEVMQNAAERMLGLTMDDKQNLITDVVYGQMRLVIADMTIEELNSDRDKFLSKVKDNIDTELRKFGLYLMNINISDIRDAANYIVNLGKEAESKAQNEAQANIEEQEKLGAIKIANQIKERETKVAETRKDQDIAIAETKKLQEISVANADKDRISQVAIANAEKESQVAKAEAEKNIRIEQANTEKESRIAELNSDMEIKQAEAQKHCVAHAAPDRAGNVLRRPDFLYQHRIDADDNHNQERLEAQRQQGFQIVLAHAAPLGIAQRGKGDRPQRGHGIYFNHSPVGHKENADG